MRLTKRTFTGLAAASLMALATDLALAQDKPYEGVTIRVLSIQQPWDE